MNDQTTRGRRFIAIGALTAHAAEGYGKGARHFPGIAAARAALEPELATGVTVLIKGSRVMGLERLVKAFESTEGTR